MPPFLIHKYKSIIVGPEWYTAAASLSCQFRDVEVCGVELSGLLEAIPILDDHPGARTCDGGNFSVSLAVRMMESAALRRAPRL